MVKTLLRAAIREIRQSIGRYLAILAIVGLGVGFFAGLRACQPDMMATGGKYLTEQKFYDFRFLSTLGFTEEDVAAFAALEGVSAAQGGVFTDFLTEIEEGLETVVKAHSITEDVNILKLSAGRMPEAPDECLGDAKYFLEEDLGTVLPVNGSNSEDTRELLRYDGYTVVGPLYVWMGYVIYRCFFSREVDLEDIIFKKDRVKTYMHADEERGRTVVSMEEALAVTDKDNLRALMLNVVRGDVRNSLASISLALNSEDSETSHYAASVLQDALNDFRTTVQKCCNEIEKQGENQLDYVVMLIGYMDQVLKQKVFTDMEQRSFVAVMDEICEILYSKKKEWMTSAQFEAVILRLLEIQEFEACEKWCVRARKGYPDTLSAYTCQMKLYFSNGDRKQFFAVMEELRNSNIVIDNETLELIRVFQ